MIQRQSNSQVEAPCRRAPACCSDGAELIGLRRRDARPLAAPRLLGEFAGRRSRASQAFIAIGAGTSGSARRRDIPGVVARRIGENG